jgi:pilus assembly protein Flp/PilA
MSAARLCPVAAESDEQGQGMVEYALILALIVIVVIVMVTLLGHQTENFYSNISSGLGT